jgi:patatin-related protein
MSAAMGDPSGPIKEVRVALVCYGGVSLAIYMHGITRELHRMVTASSRLDAAENPFKPPCTEHVYWQLLRDMADREGVRIRVVVDVISGTSAGGINGVFLAKAIAHNLSQESLRDLWFAEADLGKLLSGPSFLPAKGKLAWFGIRALAHGLRVAPPLRGDQMCRLLYAALSAMDEPPPGTPPGAGAMPEDPAGAPTSLLPQALSLELFVTATDVQGRRRYIPIADRVAGGEDHRIVSDLTHRHVMRFSLDPRQGTDDFAGRANNVALGFSARATSCFPGAFPPVSLADFMREIGVQDSGEAAAIEHEFFRAYELSQAGSRNIYFVDGGVLDNFPFGHAIDAITKKPASSEVKRWLAYIEPDPGRLAAPPPPGAPPPPPPPPPGWVQTIIAGLSTIPSTEPILDELDRLRGFNERVAYVADLARTNYPAIQAALREADLNLGEGGDVTEANVGGVNAAMNARAMQRLGSGYRSYVRLKLQQVIDDVAEIVAATWAYPPDSGQASFVRTVMLASLDQRFPAGGEEVLPEPVKAFLRTFDLGFTERRLRFVIQGVNDGYRSGTTPSPDGAPSLGQVDRGKRELLDTVKQELYGFIEELWAAASKTTIAAALGDEPFGLFKDDQLAEPLRREVSPQAFAEQHRQQLDALLDSLKGHFDQALGSFPERLWQRFVAVTSGWPELQQLLLVRFLGFPIWDTLILPVMELSGVRQLSDIEVVRISPLDGDPGLLPPKQLMGVGVHHFAAFFTRKAREHDFLWGRLDGAEQLLRMVAPGIDASWYRRAFEAVLDEEGPSLTTIEPVIQELRGKVSALKTGTEPASDASAGLAG